MADTINILSPEHFAYRFHEGDEAALKYFFDQYYGALVLYATRQGADEGFAAEMASEAFYQTWQQRHQLTSWESIRAYLYTVVKNGCYKYRMKNDSQPMPTLEVSDPERTAYESLIFAETIRELHRLITTLPRQCRAVLESLYIEGKSVKETAAEMQLAVSTVKTHKKIGLDLLRRKMPDTWMLFVTFFL